jgi:enhancing lycopene biosynthesis protein 2
MVRYVLVEWRGVDEHADEVVFEDDSVDVKMVDHLTNKLLAELSQILNEAKRANPRGYYVQIAPERTDTGARILVLRDGFALLKLLFEGIMQRLLNEHLGRKAKIAS